MIKKKYKINPETLAMEQVEQGLGYWLRQTGIYILAGIVLGVLFLYLFLIFFPSPREKQLLREKEVLESQLLNINQQVDQMQIVMTDLQQRDDNLYRVIMQADPIEQKVRDAGTDNAARYAELLQMSNGKLVASVTRQVDRLSRNVYVQDHSFNELVDLAHTQKDRMLHMPAIQPVAHKDVKRIASSFGWRVDPISGRRTFHEGIDFSANRGVPVYASGGAVVKFVGWRQGYGKEAATAVRDWAFNNTKYECLYSYMSSDNVPSYSLAASRHERYHRDQGLV